MAKRKPRLVRGIELTTEQDMWQPSKHYRWITGMYYGRARYSELRAEAQEKAL